MTEQTGGDQVITPEPYEARRRLREASLRLGVDFADTLTLIRYDPDLDTACWSYDPRSGLEYIAVGNTVLSLEIRSIEMVLRHELLHRCVYHTFHQRFADRVLANIVLDVCINRLLHEAWPEAMETLSRAIYPTASKSTLVALADCSADPDDLPEPAWSRIWRQIWASDTSGNAVNPAGLYFQLVRSLQLMDEKAATMAHQEADAHSPWNSPAEESGAPDDRTSRATARGVDGLRSACPRGSGTGRALQEYLAVPLELGIDSVEDFLTRLKVQRRISAVAQRITQDWRREVRADPYPMFPSRMGLIHQALGLSGQLHRYLNLHPAPGGAKLAVGLYLDVSPSMTDRYGIVAALARELADFAVTLRVFDTEVRPASVEDLREGRITGGMGTDFDPPIRDFLDDRELVAGVLFTDGYADVSADTARDLRRSSKDLFVVYLPGRGVPTPHSDLDPLAAEVFTFRLPEDELRYLRKAIQHVP